MDKILEKLAGVLTAEDLNEVKTAFELAVEERLQAKLDEETSNLAKKADEFCQQKIKEAVEQKTKELEELANMYCEERCGKIAESAQNKLDTQCKKLEEAAQQYIFEYFEEKFNEKYGEELQIMEDKVIENLDKYLTHIISEKIDPSLIKSTAISETYQPIIEGIQHLFEDQYVPMDLSGSKKLREANAEIAHLEESLQKQTSDNIRLVRKIDEANKKFIISEACSNLSNDQKKRVMKVFESKSLADVKAEIDDYVQIISEQSLRMRENKTQLFERKSKPVSRSLRIDDETKDMISEKKHNVELSDSEKMLLESAKYLAD